MTAHTMKQGVACPEENEGLHDQQHPLPKLLKHESAGTPLWP